MLLCGGEKSKNKLERNSISQSNDVNVKAFDVSAVKLICFAFENKGKILLDRSTTDFISSLSSDGELNPLSDPIDCEVEFF